MKRFTLSVLLCLATLLAWPSPSLAQCTAFKTYALNEILGSADINSSFSRVVTANVATCTVGYSASVTQMRITTDPYPSSTESLASTVADELARLRYQLNAIVGKTYWYQTADNALAKDVSKHWGATFTKYTEIADPATPATNNELALYAKDDGAGVTVLAYKDSAGNVSTLTGASTSYGSSITVNLKIIRNIATPTTKLDVTADRMSIEGYIVTSYSKTIDATTTGADALDAGSLANNTLYYVWAIFKPSTATAAALLSTSETAPTMPSAYTKKRMLGAFRTGGAATFTNGIQRGRTFMYETPLIVLTGGAATTATAVSLSGYVPATAAVEALINMQNVSAVSGSKVLSPFSFTGTVGFANAASLGRISTFNSTTSGVPHGSGWLPLLNATPTTFYYGVEAGSIDLYIVGWRIEWKE